jgi:hypothetical protein
VAFLSGWRGGPNEVVELSFEGVEHTQGVLESFRLLPEAVRYFRIRMPDGFAVPRLDLTFDLGDEVFVEMRVRMLHWGSPLLLRERDLPLPERSLGTPG